MFGGCLPGHVARQAAVQDDAQVQEACPVFRGLSGAVGILAAAGWRCC